MKDAGKSLSLGGDKRSARALGRRGEPAACKRQVVTAHGTVRSSRITPRTPAPPFPKVLRAALHALLEVDFAQPLQFARCRRGEALAATAAVLQQIIQHLRGHARVGPAPGNAVHRPFFAQAEDAAGADLQQFVKDEFDALFECGILAHGFLRLLVASPLARAPVRRC